jgi:hypothetical protein
MSKAAKALLVAALLAGAAASPVSAQTQSTTPTIHAGTKLNFPATLGGATFERSVNYAAPPANNPGQGMAYQYSTPKRLTISVQVYDPRPPRAVRQRQSDGDRPVQRRTRLG